MSKTLDLQEATYIEVWAEAKKYGVKTGQRNRKAVEADLQLILNDLKSKVSGGAWIVYPDGFKRGHPKKKTAWGACFDEGDKQMRKIVIRRPDGQVAIEIPQFLRNYKRSGYRELAEQIVDMFNGVEPCRSSTNGASAK